MQSLSLLALLNDNRRKGRISLFDDSKKETLYDRVSEIIHLQNNF
jgi:hypothetical protein